MNETIRELKCSKLANITQMVFNCLTLDPETRSSDRELIKTVYSEYYGIFNQPFHHLCALNLKSSFSSID